MREKLRKWMQGRYGYDELNRMLLLFVIVILIVRIFVKGVLAAVLNAAAWILLILILLRAFSRNYNACWAQNEKYLTAKDRLLVFLRLRKKNHIQRRTHHIFICPHCGQKIRVPKGKGKIEIRCPKCRGTFVRRS